MKQLPDLTPVLGLFETHLTVHDLQQSIRFYRGGRRPSARAGSPPAEGCVFLDRPRQTFHARTVGDRILTLGPSPAPCVRGDPGRRVGGAAAAEGTGCDTVILCRRGDIRAERFGMDACRGRDFCDPDAHLLEY